MAPPMRRASLAAALLLPFPLLLPVLGSLIGSPEAAGALAPLCSAGVFAVAGDPLLPDLAFEAPDLVSLDGSTLEIASGALAEVTLRQTRRGTVLRGRLVAASPAARSPFTGTRFENELAVFSWNVLMGLVGYDLPGRGSPAPKPPRIKALLDPECKVMTGRLRGRGLRREFVATAVYGEPVCGTLAGLPCAEGSFCELPPDTCQSADLAGVCVPRDVACTQQWDPVCGCDGVTYGNDCMRALAGAQKSHDGSCEPAPE
jgi:hypothetical protein